MLSRQNPGQEPHCRSRIPRIERPARRSQPVDTCPRYEKPSAAVSASPLHLHAQSSQAVKRALAIRRCGIMTDFASALCQRSEYGATMRDGFISRRLNDSGDRASRLDGSFRHETILTCGLNSLPRRRMAGPEKHCGNKERGNSDRPLCLLISSLEETSRKQTPFVLQKKHEATHR